MAKQRQPKGRTESVFGFLKSFKPRGKRGATQLYPREFTRFEVAAIGVMTTQWAYLEHMLLLATAEIVDAEGTEMPADADRVSFDRRLKAFREVVKASKLPTWKRTQLLKLATRISNIMNDRHMVTHGLWEWHTSRPTKLRLYSFRPQHSFDTNFDLPRLARVCERLGEINYELTYPPRKGLRKLTIPPEAMSYLSRELAIEWSEKEPWKFGVGERPPFKLKKKVADSVA